MDALEIAYFVGCGIVFVMCFCMLATFKALFIAPILLFQGKFIECFSTLYAYFFWFPHYAAEWAYEYLHMPFWVMRILYFGLSFPVAIVADSFRYTNTFLYVVSRICWYVLFLSVLLLRRSNLFRPSVPSESPSSIPEKGPTLSQHVPAETPSSQQVDTSKRPTVDYGAITSSLPKNFGSDALYLSKLLAKKYGMTLDEFLDDEGSVLLSNYQNWAINLKLPLPDYFSLSQKIFLYRSAESGRSVKDEIELARDLIYDNFRYIKHSPGDNSPAEDVQYDFDFNSLPPNFEEEIYRLTELVAKYNEMDFDEYIQYKKTMLLVNRHRWIIPLQLPLSDNLTEYEEVFIYQCAALGQDIEEGINFILTMIENKADVLL